MNPGFRVFAVGYAYDAASRYRYYWTQMLKSSDVSDLDTSCYPSTESTTVSTTVSTGSTTVSASTTSLGEV